MLLQKSAGKFVTQAYTDGSPVWTAILYNGKKLCNIHPNELADLEYAVRKMRKAIEVHSFDGKKETT